MSKEMRKLIDDFNTFNNRKLNENISDKSISLLILTQDFIDKVNDILKQIFNDYNVRYLNNIISDKGSKVSLKTLGDNRTVDIIYDIDTKRKRYRWKFKGENF
jgi:hypothetical protein